MRRVFADTVYWVAVANRKDQLYAKMVTAMRSLGQATLVTVPCSSTAAAAKAGAAFTGSSFPPRVPRGPGVFRGGTDEKMR